MSAPSTLDRPAGPPQPRPAAPARPRAGLLARSDARLLASELRLVLTRRRNQVMLAVLALVPALIGTAVRLSSDVEPGEGPPFLASITQNGVFLVFTALVASLPVFLPLAVSVVSGESVAGEASTGTLRYLLATPVARTRLLAVKYLGIVAYALVATSVIVVTGLAVGAALFPVGDVVLLSGTTIGYGAALARVGLVALYVTAMLATVAALGLFVSTLTEVPVAAMSATAIAVVGVQILGAVPQLAWLHPWLFTDAWLAFGDLLRDPVLLDGPLRGLGLQAGWIAVLLALSWARFAGKDVTS